MFALQFQETIKISYHDVKSSAELSVFLSLNYNLYRVIFQRRDSTIRSQSQEIAIQCIVDAP